MRLEVFFVSEALLAGIHWLHGLGEGVRLIFVACYLAYALTTLAAWVDPPWLRVWGFLSLCLLPWDLRRDMNLSGNPISIIKFNREHWMVFVVNRFFWLLDWQLFKSSLFNLLIELMGIVVLILVMHVNVLITTLWYLPWLVEVLRVVGIALEERVSDFLNLILITVLDWLVHRVLIDTIRIFRSLSHFEKSAGRVVGDPLLRVREKKVLVYFVHRAI